MPQRSGHRAAIYEVVKEQSVEVWEKIVSDVENVSDVTGGGVTKISRILISDEDRIMVPTEWVKCSKLMPAETQLLSCLPNEATDVRPNHGNAKLVELEHPYDGVSQVRPVGEVVPQPVRHPAARTHEC